MTSSWKSQPLAEVCQFINRGISPTYLDAGGIAVLNQKCVRDHTVNFNLGRRHDAAAKKVTPERFVRAGDVLVNSTGTGTLGRVAQLRHDPPEPTTVDSHVTIVRPAPGLFHPEFFGYALVAIEEEIQKGGEGCGGQTELSRTKLAEGYRISFPPDQDEQRRIVAILDEAFEGIATAKANAEKNLQNAQEIFDSYLSRVFSATHELVPLAELATEITDGDHMPPPKAPTGVPFITISNIAKRRRTIEFDDTFMVSPEYYAQLKPNRKPRRGDVLYTVTGATLGIPVLVDYDTEFCFQRHIALIRPRPGTSSAWLCYMMASPQVFAQATAGATGAAQKTVSLAVLRSINVPRHTEARQVCIAAQLDELFAHTCKLEILYHARVAALDELKKALLQRAFSGTLRSRSIEREVAEVT